MDPAQLATETALAAFFWNLLIVLFLGMTGGGVLALMAVTARALALRGEREHWPNG